MFKKLLRVLLGQSTESGNSQRIHESGQLSILSTQEMELRRMYERMAHHQRLIEVEDELYSRF